jgi:hypothetical protein
MCHLLIGTGAGQPPHGAMRVLTMRRCGWQALAPSMVHSLVIAVTWSIFKKR